MSDEVRRQLSFDGEPLVSTDEMVYGIGVDDKGDTWVYAAFKADAAIDLFQLLGSMVPGYGDASEAVAKLMGIADASD